MAVAALAPDPASAADPTDTYVVPGESIQEAVDANPEGVVITIAAGIHRNQSVVPKEGNVFVGEPEAILSGAAVMTDFERRSGYWVITGQDAEGFREGECIDGYAACIYPEQLFIDGVPLWQVDTLEEVGNGTFYFDYDADEVWFFNFPQGRLVELSITPHAFWGDVDDVTIRGLTIEKYANPASSGAIEPGVGDGYHPSGWMVARNTVRHNAGAGIALSHDMIVRYNHSHDNGRAGVGAGTITGGVVEYNILERNCWTGGFACFGWGGGGMKLSGAIDTVFRYNTVVANNGAGLHTDGYAQDIGFVGNDVLRNAGAGIILEISYGGRIEGNHIEGNGFERPRGLGGGVGIQSTPDVEIVGNTFVGNAHYALLIDQIPRDPGPLGPFEIDNIFVKGNTFHLGEGQNALKSSRDPNYFRDRNIRFNGNTYADVASDRPFGFGVWSFTPQEWQEMGYDRSSTGLD